jgi:hypothetical protein
VITPWLTGSFWPRVRAMTTTNAPSHQSHGDAGTCCASTHDDVARAAFGLYEAHGSQDGNDVRNWLDAEAQVRTRRSDAMPARRAGDKMADRVAL